MTLVYMKSQYVFAWADTVAPPVPVAPATKTVAVGVPKMTVCCDGPTYPYKLVAMVTMVEVSKIDGDKMA